MFNSVRILVLNLSEGRKIKPFKLELKLDHEMYVIEQYYPFLSINNT